MKVDGKPPVGIGGFIREVSQTEKAEGAKGAKNGRKTPLSVQGEKVEISQEALLVRELVEKAKAFPEVREDLVKELRARIQEGSYEPPLEELASRLLLEALLEEV